MSEEFDWEIFRGSLVKGDLRSAMDYLHQLPEQAELYQKYTSLFREENYRVYDVDPDLNEILLIYQKYYRDAFFLELPPEDAAQTLRQRLADLLRVPGAPSLDTLEENAADVFRKKSLHVLTGRTGGYYGPYIWRSETLARYTVELPEGVQEYAVKLLDHFVMTGWLDYLSFGAVSTGGWASGDGLIHCVRSSYDLESEAFQVSLLKHEAQHAVDLAHYPNMSSEDLEYRAKLVELIYSSQRRLLDRFLCEANAARASNGHGRASARIAEDFQTNSALSIPEVQAAAQALFAESSREMAKKYA